MRTTFAALAGAVCVTLTPLSTPPAIASSVIDRVERVVDGDTIITKSAGSVRLIGMNTPETVAPAQKQGAPPQCYGPEASAATKRLLPVGTAVRLESDQEETDKYGRRLAYVFREPDDAFINAQLVQEGFARVRSYKPNTRYEALLKEYQADAQKSSRGLWGACAMANAPASETPPAATAAARPPPRSTASSPATVSTTPQLANPGDTKNCADFASYAEAKAWFDTYVGMYGDVAKLDGNGDGIPCESLLSKEQRAAVRS